MPCGEKVRAAELIVATAITTLPLLALTAIGDSLAKGNCEPVNFVIPAIIGITSGLLTSAVRVYRPEGFCNARRRAWEGREVSGGGKLKNRLSFRV